MVDQLRDQPLLRLEENCHFHSTESFRLRPDSTLIDMQDFPFDLLNVSRGSELSLLNWTVYSVCLSARLRKSVRASVNESVCVRARLK